MKPKAQKPQIELSIESLVLDGVPLQPGLAAEVEAELMRLFSSPEGAQALLALQGGPAARDIGKVSAAFSAQPGGPRLGKNLGGAIYKTVSGLHAPVHPKEGRS